MVKSFSFNLFLISIVFSVFYVMVSILNIASIHCNYKLGDDLLLFTYIPPPPFFLSLSLPIKILAPPIGASLGITPSPIYTYMWFYFTIYEINKTFTDLQIEFYNSSPETAINCTVKLINSANVVFHGKLVCNAIYRNGILTQQEQELYPA